MKKIDELKAEIKKAEKELESKKEELRLTESSEVIEVGEYVRVRIMSMEFIGRFDGICDGEPIIKSFTSLIGKSIGIVTKWQPKKGDLCIFWDRDIASNHVVRFFDSKKRYRYFDSEGVWWGNCIPFISAEQLKEHIGYEE